MEVYINFLWKSNFSPIILLKVAENRANQEQSKTFKKNFQFYTFKLIKILGKGPNIGILN